MQFPPQGGAHDYAAELNEEQFRAVTTAARRALVIAGAGSGKTRTLTYRVAYLLEQGVPPWRIMLLTFTNKAAREMLTRVAGLTGTDAHSLWGGTFHSIAFRILRRHAERLGYLPGFTIFDSDDQKALMKNLVKQHAGSMKKSDRFPKAEILLGLYSLAVNTADDWRHVLHTRYQGYDRFEDTLAAIFDDYAKRKLSLNAMDFDDLLTNLLRLLQECSDVRDDLQSRFQHVLVDEYQDTNTIQDRIVALLSGGEGSSLMAVGDDAQSIYSWRGADVKHILRFRDTYPDAEVYRITTNYRSVPAILDISNAAIALNENQIPKELRAARPAGAMKPAIIMAPDNHREAESVARRIDELMGGGIPGKDIAVLYRAHFHSLDVQMELSRAHIPFRITSGLRFFEQAHVKDVVAFLRLLSNPRDEIAFRRIVATFPGVGDVTAGKMWSAWLSCAEAWLAAHPGAARIADPHSKVMEKAAVPPKVRPFWQGFLTLMDSLHPDDHTLLPPELVHAVHQYLTPYLHAAYENFEEREEDIAQLARTVGEEEDLEAFLSQIALLSEVDKDAPVDDDDCVTLSTVHQAKGLEWKVVFIIFLADGMFPHSRVLESGDEDAVEEETRLFYVAVTRAQDQLYMSFPRFNGRSYDSMRCAPSRFLVALPQELVDLWQD